MLALEMARRRGNCPENRLARRLHWSEGMDTQIATTIRDQIGPRALMMIGAKYLLADGNALTFRPGRNPKGVNHVRIELMPDDTYTVTVANHRMNRKTCEYKIRVIETMEMVYAEDLRRVIESMTGLYTSL